MFLAHWWTSKRGPNFLDRQLKRVVRVPSRTIGETSDGGETEQRIRMKMRCGNGPRKGHCTDNGGSPVAPRYALFHDIT